MEDVRETRWNLCKDVFMSLVLVSIIFFVAGCSFWQSKQIKPICGYVL